MRVSVVASICSLNGSLQYGSDFTFILFRVTSFCLMEVAATWLVIMRIAGKAVKNAYEHPSHKRIQDEGSFNHEKIGYPVILRRNCELSCPKTKTISSGSIWK